MNIRFVNCQRLVCSGCWLFMRALLWIVTGSPTYDGSYIFANGKFI